MLHDVVGALRAGDAAAALAAALHWTEAEPADADALLWLAHAHGANRDTAAAGQAIDRALALAPDRADLLTARAYLDLQGRDLARAEAGLGAALAQDPNQFPAYVALAHLAMARGDLDEAGRHIAYAKRIDAEHPRLLLLEAQLAGAQGDAERVLPLMNVAAQRAPDDPLVMAALGIAFYERGHFAFAVEALRRAIALSSAAPALRGALIAALEAQGHHDLALEEAEAWMAVQPGSPVPRWHRGRLLALAGQFAAALVEIEAVQAQVARHPQALELALQLRGQTGGPAAVLAGLEAQIAADPGWSLPWQRLLSLLRAEQVPALVRRWHSAAPASPEALEAAALLAEREGREGDALALAAEAIALEPRLLEARLLQARASTFLEPEAAVARIDALMAAAVAPEQVRALSGWRGAALHRAGRSAEALEAWRRMWTDGPAFGLPLPNPEPASAASPQPDGGAGLLLWGPPGSRVERVHAAVVPALEGRILMDRWQHPLRDDGFNLLRVAPSDPRAGTAARWRAPIEGAGLAPEAMVDALPFWDGWTQATLHGTTLVAVLRDPRDLLLNWLAWGSATGLTFPSPGMAAAWLHRLLEQLLEAEAQRPGQVVRLDADLLDRDPVAFAASLAGVFGLTAAADVATATMIGLLPNGQPADFPAGAWRQYAEPLKGLFAPLGELAVRLGYPAE